MADIMILEPDERLGQKMCDALHCAGHECILCLSASEGVALMRDHRRMLVIVNAQLPWTDSFAFLRALEERGWPLLFITADAGNADHLRAMYQAGCDVLIRPFDAHGLLAAVNALLEASGRVLTLGPLRMDVSERCVTLAGVELSLTAQEFSLLRALMLSPDAALTREELLRTAWGYQDMGETRTVDVHIQRLRRKLGATSIETVYKLGYRLKMA